MQGVYFLKRTKNGIWEEVLLTCELLVVCHFNPQTLLQAIYIFVKLLFKIYCQHVHQFSVFSF